MATITLTVVGSAVGTLTTVTDLDQYSSDSLMAFLAANYGTTRDANGDEVQRTPQEMVDAYWSGIVRGTLNNVDNWNKNEAAKTAAQAVPPTTATIDGEAV